MNYGKVEEQRDRSALKRRDEREGWRKLQGETEREGSSARALIVNLL